MTKLVTIFGGSGFVGRYVARRMAKEGWRVRVATRDPNAALFVKPYGATGQVEPVFCNIRDDASVSAVLNGADAVVNCVGTFDATGKNNFDAIQHEGAARVARLAKAAGCGRLVHISAIGADVNAASEYARTKGLGEAAVLESFADAVILRPSVIFGTEDEFFNRFAAMTSFGPVLPIAGADTLFQPVWVDDVAQAAVKGATGQIAGGVYELGGPDVRSFRDLMAEMLTVIQRRRLIVNLPWFVARLVATFGGIAQTLSIGIVKSPLTKDQVISLQSDNIVAEGAKGFADIGITPTTTEAILPEYLWRFRPSGQYAAIKDSAKNLRKA